MATSSYPIRARNNARLRRVFQYLPNGKLNPPQDLLGWSARLQVRQSLDDAAEPVLTVTGPLETPDPIKRLTILAPSTDGKLELYLGASILALFTVRATYVYDLMVAPPVAGTSGPINWDDARILSEGEFEILDGVTVLP
jgi:hypothetical protein